MEAGFSLVERLARWQLDCPTLVDPGLGARADSIRDEVPARSGEAPGDELAQVAILSEN
ncbi:hypothetical protein J5J83_05075 [Azoarcus sp. L1K30]|uniref:hypothetical protein n=1 Tax=Azoarcus sp. L1K30 TaxID=2820277 RepID=UPI001B811642|nr:hypothetical protein [Azoarcus sp. L1K30]MBR0565491.1 hypothetical protein [Azoarcus sp. L1K30]